MAKATREKNKPVYKVKSSFRDRNNFTKEYKEGDDVSNLESSIIDSLLERGLIEEEGVGTKADEANGTDENKDADKGAAETDKK